MANGIQWDDQEIGGGSSGIQWDDEQPVAQQAGSQASAIAWDDEQSDTDSQNGVRQESSLIDRALDAGASFLGRGLSAMPGPGSQVAGALLEGTNADQDDPQYRTWGEAAQDTGIAALKGGVGLAQGALELSRYTPHSRIMDAAGFRPQDAIEEEVLAPAQDYWQGAKSEGLQAQEQLVHGADGFLGTMGAAVDNPGVIGAVISEQAIPMMLQVGVAGKVAQAVAPMLGREAAARASGVAALSFEGGQAGGMTGHEVRDYLMNQAQIEDLRESPDFVSLEQEYGEQRAREITADRLAPVGAAMAGAATALVGKYLGEGSRVAGLVVPDGKTGLRAGASRVGMETLTEGIQEPVEGLAGDVAKSQADSTVDPTDLSERGSEAALGMFAGMGQASGMEVGRAFTGQRSQAESDSEPEVSADDALPNQDEQLSRAEGLDPGLVEQEAQANYRSLDEIMRAHGVEPATVPEWKRRNEAPSPRKTLLDNLREQYGRTAQQRAEAAPEPARGLTGVLQEQGYQPPSREPEPKSTLQRLVEENRERRQARARRQDETAPYNAVLEQLRRENAGAAQEGVDRNRDDLLTAIAKRGGLDPNALGGEVDVATMGKMSRVGRPVVRKAGEGQTMDHMAETLAQEGFTAPDGSPLDPNSLADLIDRSSRGERVFAASSDRAGMVDADNEIAKRWFQGDASKVENALQKYIDGKPLTPNQQGAVDDITNYLRGNDGSIYREREIEAAQDMDVLQGELPSWYGEIADMDPAAATELMDDVSASSIAQEADAGNMEAEEAAEHASARALLDESEYQATDSAVTGLDEVLVDYMMKAARAGATDEQINQALDNANGSRAAAIGGLLALQTGEDARGQEPLAAIDWRYEQEAGAEPAGADRPQPPTSVYESEQQPGTADGLGRSEESRVPSDRTDQARREVEAEPEPPASDSPVASEAPADAGVSRSGESAPKKWKKDGKRLWRSSDGMIITDESMTVGGVRQKNYFVYENAQERDRGNNFASAESYAEAKRKAERGPELELKQQTEESRAAEESEQRQVEARRQQEEREAEQRRQADSEAGDFRLSGSDRPTDVATAGGQQDLVAAAAAETDTSPSEAQIEADNYKKGRIRIQGLDIAIENPKGSTRSGTAPDGTRWETTMAHHYGDIKRTEGADGDNVDVFIGPNPDSASVFIIDQVDADGSFDEHKVMLGFPNQKAARDGYRANYEKGWKVGPTTKMTMDQFKDWLAQGDTTRPVKRDHFPDARKKVVTPEKPSQPIEDFGEKLEGARKDMAGKLADAAKRDTAEAPLSESWPQPDYQKMLDDGFSLEAVSVLRVLRDAVPAKPRHRGKKRMWAKKVEVLRGLAMEILGNPDAAAKVRSELESISTVSGLSGAVDLYMTAGHDQSLKGLTLSAAAYSIYDGVPQNPSKTVWEVRKQAKVTGFSNMPRVIAKGDTKEQALNTFKKAVASLEDKAPKSKKPVRFDIYSRRGQEGWLVGKKVGRDYVDLERLDSPSEAREYLANNQDALEAKLAKIKEVPDHRKENNSPRVGASHRNGDVTPEQFAEEFGFRGVQFGNWVEQGRRQQDLNEAYDALMDLAGILNVPARAMSLGGELGLAFGARGKGGKNPAKAHYEPGEIVINLTKKDGAGSLAHEWWHALDNYFTRERGADSDSSFATEGAAHVSVRPEVRNAFTEVTRAVNRTRLKERARKLDKTRTKAYWSTGREMSARAFESYVIEQLRDQGAANDYLANIVSPEYWKAAEALTLEKEDTYPYPEAAEVPAIREAFDHFFQVVETKEDDQGNVALFSMSPIEIDQTDAEYASALMNVVAQHDDVYRTPVSFEDSFKGVMQEIIPQIEVAAEPEMAEVMKATYPDLQGMWYLTLPGSEGTAYVYEEANRVWIDVSELKSGRGGGFRIYSAVANYAHNAGKVFDGDPAGLSNLGVLRRTEQMLSSALKFGTTRHLNPHPRQVSPDLEMADIARPLDWKTDQDQHNLVEMLKSSYHNILTVVPEVRDVVFNAENGQFERNGSPVSERQFSAMAADSVRRRSEAVGSNVRGRKAALAGPVYGSASLKRAALINTVVRGKGREKWRSLLAALNDQLRRGERGGLANTLYSNTTEARPSAGLSASGLQQTLRKAVGKRLADSIEVVQSVSDLPDGAGLQSLSGSGDATNSPAFKRWFGDSKVVDAEGKPLVVYRGEHGRQKEDAGGFQSRLGSISFGAREAANTYSTMANNHADSVVEARVYPVYLRIENPVVNDSSDPFIDLAHIEKRLGREEAERVAIEHEGHLTNTNNWDEVSEDLGISDVQSLIESHPERLGDLYLDAYPVLDDRTFVQKAMEAGYDGAIHGGMGETSGEPEYRVFSDTSVKSAIGNRGTFDPNSPDIRESRAADRVEGMFDPATGKVYLVADNIPSEDRAAWVAWHELWHRGIRSIDGRRGKLPGSPEGQALRQAVNRAGLNKTTKDLADAIIRDRGMPAGQRDIAVEEALAELNAADETGDYRGIERRYGVKVPQGMRKGIRGHIDRFLEAVKRVLSKLTGRVPADVSNQEVWQIVTGARAGYADPSGAAGNRGGQAEPRHSFAGASALTADHNSLYRAMDMAKRGKSSEVIRRETGWHRSVDGKWRFEITDDGARLRVGTPQQVEDEALSRVHQEAKVSKDSESGHYRAVIDDRGPDHLAAFGRTETDALSNLHNALIKRAMQGQGFVSIDAARTQSVLRVGDLLDHPALFAAYPAIRDYKVELYNMGEDSYGSLDIANKTIEINHTRGNDAILSTLLHEIQHAIQDIEGFAQGGAPQQRFTDSVKSALSRLEGEAEAEVMQWKRSNHKTISDAEKASELARHGLMYESAKRLVEYAQHESPSRVFRHIRNEMQWIYPGSGDPVAQELQRRFYVIPKRHKPAERKAFLAEMAMDASHWLRDQVPKAQWKQFENDPRTMKGMLRALERESSRARDKLEPLRELEREAQDSKAVNESSRFKSPYEVYRSLAGEIEARNTQSRQHMTDAERHSTPPQQTADVAAHEAIVIVGGMEVQAPKAFSVAPDQMALAAESDGAIPEETRFRAAQRKLQDRFNRFTVVQDWLKEQGVKLTSGADVYRAEERMHGRIAAQLEDFRDKTVRPLVKRIRQSGYSMEQVAEFLHAQHARERNAQIAKVNKAMPDGGSGMNNAEADAVLAKYADAAEFQALANELRGITDQSRKILVDAGIITEEMADAWQAAYQHYVPLKGGPESTFTGSTGKGLTSKARLNRALGHGEREGGEWIIENILADHERAVMLAEKNLVGRHLLQMALEVGNPELLTVAQPEKRGVLKDKKAYAVWHKGSVLGAFDSKAEASRFITEKTNLQGLKVSDFAVEETREPDVVYMARPQLADNETQVYVKGHAIRIQLNDELLARAWNKLGDEAVGTILQHMRGLNRYLSQVYTGYNPEFLATNMVRDLFTGTANLTGEEGAAMAVRALARYPSTFGQLLAHHVAGRTSRLMEEYREDGGQTGAAWLSDLERVGDDVRNTFDDAMRLSEVARKSGKGRAATSAWRRLIGNLLGWMEHINAAGENAFRLATYSAMRDAGKTRSEAVNAAKNVTVNFNRKGEMGASLSAMYLFFNPAIQGTASIAHAHFKGKNKEQAWAMSAGMMVAGFMYALANAGADEEEWEGVPEWEKERHIMVKTGDGWARIPLPYGHGWFWSTGRHMADLFTGDVDPEKASLRISASFVEEFSIFGPVVNGGELEAENLLFLAPTVMQIPGAVAVNQTSMGREVYPEMDWDEGIPDHQKMYRNTQGTMPEVIASNLNRITGGDAVAGGRVDVSPETLKYFWRTFTGGAGSFFSDAFNLPVLIAQDVRPDELESREIPLLRRFYRDVDVRDARTRYYNAIEESRTALGEFMRAKRMDKQKRDTSLELTKKYGLSNLEAVRVGKMAERYGTLIRLKREAQIATMLSDKPLGWRRAQVRILEREEAKLYDEVLEKMGLSR